MRSEFISQLIDLSRHSEDTFLVVGDLGYGVIEPFKLAFPERFMNAGVAEQSMISLAAGVASQGPTVFAYSIANFPTFRALEQIRNDVVAHKLPVTIVSVGAGLSYGAMGSTHHSTEDLAIMRSLQDIDIYSPGDSVELFSLLPLIIDRKRPAYLRLGKGGEQLLHKTRVQSPEKGVKVSGPSESDFIVLSTGAIGSNVATSIELLKPSIKRRVRHYSVPILDSVSALSQDLARAAAILSVEEHTPSGGLGSLILETLSAAKASVPIKRLGTKKNLTTVVGSHEYLLRRHELDPASIAREIEDFFLGLSDAR